MSEPAKDLAMAWDTESRSLPVAAEASRATWRSRLDSVTLPVAMNSFWYAGRRTSSATAASSDIARIESSASLTVNAVALPVFCIAIDKISMDLASSMAALLASVSSRFKNPRENPTPITPKALFMVLEID